jgi:hypothetical protein
MNLSPVEEEHIKLLRQIKIEFGRIPCVIYFQHGKAVRIEYENPIISQMAKKEG